MHATSTKKRVNPVVLIGSILAVLLVAGGMLLYPRHLEFERTTFTGKTKMGSIIALELRAEDGKVFGEGFHRFSSGKVNPVFISGTLSKKGNLYISEHNSTTNQFFGSVGAMLDIERGSIKGYWYDKHGGDATKVVLSKTNYSSNDILIATSVPRQKKRNGDTIGDWVDDLISGTSNAFDNTTQRFKNSRR